MNHRVAFGSLAALTLLAAPAAAQQTLWSRQFGSDAIDRAFALAADPAGGAFIAGETEGNLAGPLAGGLDAWFGRYDAEGNRLWVRQLGTAVMDSAWALAPDGGGGAFVAGPTAGNLAGTNAGEDDVWLARYDTDGNRVWLIQFGSAGAERAFGLASDDAGGAYVAGDSWGDLAAPNAGGADAWIARYDADGNRLWIRQFGTLNSDRCAAITPDGSGGAYVAGFTGGSLAAPHAGEDDAWLARYDRDGNRLWIRQLGTTAWDRSSPISADGMGGVLVAGYTFGPLGGPSAGELDAWMARYDGDGNRQWIRQFGTPTVDWIRAIIADGSGGAFVGGSTYGSLAAPTAGWTDPWLAHYSADGDRLWIRQFGTPAFEHAYALVPDGKGGMFIAGDTAGSLAGPNAGNYDAWIARWTGAICPGTGAGACSPADWNEDGTIDFNDLLAFVNDFNAQATCADLNADGSIDFNDLLQFLNAYNDGC